MAATPASFRSSPDPEVVDQFVTEGLADAEDEASHAWLLLARGMSARLWRGSEPFGQGRSRTRCPSERGSPTSSEPWPPARPPVSPTW